MKKLLILPFVLALAGCWTLRPDEHIEFSDRLTTSRQALAEAPEITMERDSLRLLATALPENAPPLFFYTDRWVSRESELDASAIEEILSVTDESGQERLRSLEPGSEEFQSALTHFPELRAFREASKGYEEPKEDDWPHLFRSPYEAGALQWEFAYRLPGENGPLTFSFFFRGSEEEDTESLRVRLTDGDGREVTVRLPRGTLGMKERMDAEVQRLIRATAWDGERYALVFDRIVDLETGEIQPLVSRVPSDYIDHIAVSEDFRRVQLIFGKFRITKRTLTAPIRWPGDAP